jgi:hypothetical protein
MLAQMSSGELYAGLESGPSFGAMEQSIYSPAGSGVIASTAEEWGITRETAIRQAESIRGSIQENPLVASPKGSLRRKPSAGLSSPLQDPVPLQDGPTSSLSKLGLRGPEASRSFVASSPSGSSFRRLEASSSGYMVNGTSTKASGASEGLQGSSQEPPLQTATPTRGSSFNRVGSQRLKGTLSSPSLKDESPLSHKEVSPPSQRQFTPPAPEGNLNKQPSSVNRFGHDDDRESIDELRIERESVDLTFGSFGDFVDGVEVDRSYSHNGLSFGSILSRPVEPPVERPPKKPKFREIREQADPLHTKELVANSILGAKDAVALGKVPRVLRDLTFEEKVATSPQRSLRQRGDGTMLLSPARSSPSTSPNRSDPLLSSSTAYSGIQGWGEGLAPVGAALFAKDLEHKTRTKIPSHSKQTQIKVYRF